MSKALIAANEDAGLFEVRVLHAEHPGNGAELERCWPVHRFALLLDDERAIVRPSIIGECPINAPRRGRR